MVSMYYHEWECITWFSIALRLVHSTTVYTTGPSSCICLYLVVFVHLLLSTVASTSGKFCCCQIQASCIQEQVCFANHRQTESKSRLISIILNQTDWTSTSKSLCRTNYVNKSKCKYMVPHMSRVCDLEQVFSARYPMIVNRNTPVSCECSCDTVCISWLLELQ